MSTPASVAQPGQPARLNGTEITRDVVAAPITRIKAKPRRPANSIAKRRR